MDRREYAVELKHSKEKHNCCQAVLCAFADQIDLPYQTIRKLGANFGTGMGCMEATCGALCAIQILFGLRNFQGKPLNPKAAVMLRMFEEKCGATLCKDLKGRDTGVVLCECDDCVRNAVAVYEEFVAAEAQRAAEESLKAAEAAK